MASIMERRNRRGGLIGWQALVRRKGYPVQTRTFGNYRDAELWAATIESEMGRGVWRPSAEAENTTLREALERYAAEITPRKRGARQETGRVNKLLRHPLALRSLAAVRGKDVADFIHSREAEGAGGNTIRLDLALISHVYTIARSVWGMESLVNPVALVRGARPRLPAGRDRRLGPGEEARLLAAASEINPELNSIIVIAIETAMRQGEIISMRWADVDLKARTVRLVQTKNGTPRTVPLSTRAAGVLADLPRRIDGRVWSYSVEGVRSGWQKARARAGITGLTFHDLRHESVSRLFEAGFNPLEVATISGHKTLQMLRRYTHLRAQDLVDRLG